MKVLLLYILLFLCAPITAQRSETTQIDAGKFYALDKDILNGFDSIHPLYKWEYSNIQQRFSFLIDREEKIDSASVRSMAVQTQFCIKKQGLKENGRIITS